MDRPWSQEVDRFCYQYLQLESNLDWPRDEFLRLDEVQDAIYKRIFKAEASNVGPPDRYRIKILKELVFRIESAIDDWDRHAAVMVVLTKVQKAVSDDIMATLSAALAIPLTPGAISAQRKCYVTYHLSLLERGTQLKTAAPHPSITLLENRNLIAAGGTTGHRTWEAALQLGQYLCQNPSLVSGKRVLELGAGTGYPSVLCVKHLQAAHAIVSDGSEDVIDRLLDNLFLNSLQDSPKISPMGIKWGHALVGTEEEKWNGGQPVDVVLGADITYDARAMPALAATLFDLFGMYPSVKVYISATERNAETYQTFLEVCRQCELAVEDLHVDVPPRSQQNGPFYDDQLAIHLCRVSKT
ncbi:uncharacterized protein MAM_07281 [Metarhizium album ARSEF 1941]|uniref:FAM86A protein n=1 Tax=Metarhizium album (strain ARSEF 1941) TaxID=1081103 RepID=A0A0B2WMZ6_METAS|nr:uncharacterized protein MAM_07281 [Metarhizium album ARSEF 1941]KHN94862.1 hypothetical protein MAM_07281 [Metarhizium album ARSEF 1941]